MLLGVLMGKCFLSLLIMPIFSLCLLCNMFLPSQFTVYGDSYVLRLFYVLNLLSID